MKPQQCLVPGAGAGTERRRTGTTSGSKQESMAKEVHSVKGRPKSNRVQGIFCQTGFEGSCLG